MNNFSESYEVILKTLKTIEPNINFLNQIRIQKLADIELIAVSITAECLSEHGYKMRPAIYPLVSIIRFMIGYQTLKNLSRKF